MLAAGYGTRLGSLAGGRAKPLLDVGGRAVLSHTLDRVLELDDLTEIVVVTNGRFHGQVVAWSEERERAPHEAPRSLAEVDPDRGPGGARSALEPHGAPIVPIRILNDGTTDAGARLGATRDLALALETVPPRDEPWLVLAGDNLISFDLRPLQRAFREADTPLLLLRRAGWGADEGRYNEVTLDEDGRVLRFREKAPDPVSRVRAIGLYFFTPHVAALVPRYLESGGDGDAPGHFVSWLVERTPVRGAFFEGEWFDAGSADGLAAARRRFGS